jgi:hypothetical protein
MLATVLGVQSHFPFKIYMFATVLTVAKLFYLFQMRNKRALCIFILPQFLLWISRLIFARCLPWGSDPPSFISHRRFLPWGPLPLSDADFTSPSSCVVRRSHSSTPLLARFHSSSYDFFSDFTVLLCPNFILILLFSNFSLFWSN